MPNEVELKLGIAAADLPRLRRHPAILDALTAPPVTRKLTSIYYDTPTLALLDAGLSLRVRRMAGQWFQAVKAAGHAAAGLHQRMEWEDIIAFGHPDFSKITDPALTRVFDDMTLRQALAAIFSTEVRRTEWQLAWDNGDRVELALDVGALVAGRHREPIREIELELKAGDTLRLFTLALELQQDIPLQLDNTSKAQRGYARYRPQAPRIVKAREPHLKPGQDAHDAFRQIAWECTGQLQGNQDMVLHGHDSEGVHQMRVALRRLRAAFSVFAAALPEAAGATLLPDIRWLAATLGTARDLDVLLEDKLTPAAQAFLDHEGLDALRRKLERARQTAYGDVRTALGSPRYHRLLLALGACLESVPPHAGNALELARARLTRDHRRLLRHGKQLSELNPEERHAARIAAKKLRYSAEFFVSLFPREKSRRYLRALAALQDVLGELNDLAVADARLPTLAGKRPTPDMRAALDLLRGWNAGLAFRQRTAMLQTWRRFARQTPFWK